MTKLTNLRYLQEKDLFIYLRENKFTDLVESRNKMSIWDCYSPKEKSRIELKCRRVHYQTLLIEKKKYDSMIEKCKKYSDIPLYINSTPKGIYCFNLLLLDVKWEGKMLPQNTDFGGSKKIIKEVGFLNISDAYKIL